MKEQTSTPDCLVVIVCRACFVFADVLLIGITWFTISWRGMVDSVGRKDFLSLGEVMFRNGEVSSCAASYLASV